MPNRKGDDHFCKLERNTQGMVMTACCENQRKRIRHAWPVSMRVDSPCLQGSERGNTGRTFNAKAHNEHQTGPLENTAMRRA